MSLRVGEGDQKGKTDEESGHNKWNMKSDWVRLAWKSVEPTAQVDYKRDCG